MKILVLNGPNLNLLGVREPDIYGKETYEDLVNLVTEEGKRLGIQVEHFQSNHEGDLVDKIQRAYFDDVDGIVFNPAAYTHTSIALLDALQSVKIPTVEVHISDVSSREKFRQVSYIREACFQVISGKGLMGYVEALQKIVSHLNNES